MGFIEKRVRTVAEVKAELAVMLTEILDGFDVLDVRRDTFISGNRRIDILAKVRVGRTERALVIEVKAKGEPRYAKLAIQQLKALLELCPNGYPVFAAPYISQRTREICKKEGVGFIDLVGNVYLRFSSVLVDIVSPETWPSERRRAKKLFTPKGTRVIRALLQDHDRPARITDLADICDMSPGGVHWTVELLEDRGYVERDERKRVVLARPGDLLDAWAKEWSMDRNDWETFFSLESSTDSIMASLADAALGTTTEYAFTLLAGASQVAPYVRFNDVWVYIGREEEGWGRNLDLQPVDSGGNVIIIRPYEPGVFMGLQDLNGFMVVSNIQLYIDLYNFKGRGREQAEFLRETALGF